MSEIQLVAQTSLDWPSNKCKKKVVFCTPHYPRPHPEYIKSLEASLPLIVAAGWEEGYAQLIKNPYISAARSSLTRAALDADATVIVYIDQDVSWDPPDLLKLIETEGDVVAGVYRMKMEETNYMGAINTTAAGYPIVRPSDGAIDAARVPAGFLKVTLGCIDKFMHEYPDLCYGPMYHLSIDLFNHGAYERMWWGEDYAFSRRWTALGQKIWIVPNLNISHWAEWSCSKCSKENGFAAMECVACAYVRQGEGSFPGNFHEFMLRQPGGSKAVAA